MTIRFSRLDRNSMHRVIGRESERVTRTQCEEFIEQARTDARAGRLKLPKGRKLGLTLAAAAPKYLSLLEEEGGKNLEAKRRHLRTVPLETAFLVQTQADAAARIPN